MAGPLSIRIRVNILFTRSDSRCRVKLSNRGALKLELFHVDGIGGVALSGGVAYIEFSQFTQLPRGKDEPKTAPSHRVSMSLDTLLRLHQALSGATQQLEERGVIKRRADAPAETKQ